MMMPDANYLSIPFAPAARLEVDMQFREMGRRIQCIRTLRRGEQIIIATIPRDSVQIPPGADMAGLTAAERTALEAWLIARAERQAREQADAIIAGMPHALREMIRSLEQGTVRTRRGSRPVRLRARVVRDSVRGAQRLIAEIQRISGRTI
ncbi:MAG: hypothetical protein ACYDBH_11010 [Acidobacteriaceae bacterium]